MFHSVRNAAPSYKTEDEQMKKQSILKGLAVGLAACALVACSSENATNREAGPAATGKTPWPLPPRPRPV